jgi:hypothetical protein
MPAERWGKRNPGQEIIAKADVDPPQRPIKERAARSVKRS